MGVVTHPQQLAALLTRLFQRGRALIVCVASGRGGRVRRTMVVLLLRCSSSFFLPFRLHLLSSSLFRSGEKTTKQTPGDTMKYPLPEENRPSAGMVANQADPGDDPDVESMVTISSDQTRMFSQVHSAFVD